MRLVMIQVMTKSITAFDRSKWTFCVSNSAGTYRKVSKDRRIKAIMPTDDYSRSCPLASTDLFRQLHWLPIEWRTSLTYKALHTGHPPYLA